MSTQVWYPEPLAEDGSYVSLVRDKFGRLITREGATPVPVQPIRKPTRTIGWGDCHHREGRQCRNCM